MFKFGTQFHLIFTAIIRAQSRIIFGCTKVNVYTNSAMRGFNPRPFTIYGYSEDVTLKDWIVNEIIELFPVGDK
jgi:hypothetical protein